MSIRLIALDIDGTLLDSEWQVPEANLDAVARAVARGIEVVRATGRRFDFARPIAEQLPAPVTLIVSNGALVKSGDGSTRLAHLLSADVARRILEATVDFRESAAVVFDRQRERQLIFERIDWQTPSRRTAFAEKQRAYIAEVDPLEECLIEDPVQVSFNGTFADMVALQDAIASLPFRGSFSLAVTEYESRDFTLDDVMAPGCSKGATLERWAGSRGIARAEVMAVGDNLNDIEMLEYAGLPVVMGNAVPALRRDGWHVTGTNDEAGVAEAIERFVLREPS
ncbi:MAG: HAD family phosphatase [Acidobacteria bacterium]|nr:MAG: HAD family phosphatase [Acidobacteriota bacterium]RPJ83786.1 MAG: HAD family phosphatase [Acidobacteriota bacterium]